MVLEGWWWGAAGVGLLLLWRARAQAVRASLPPGGDDGTLVGLWQRGHRVEAVRRYRERNHCGLKEAKDAVEALASGRSPARAPGAPPALGPDVEALVRAGQLLSAIRVHREANPDLSLAEAKAAVDALARRLKG
jgi:ribosomal protein L7/L12